MLSAGEGFGNYTIRRLLGAGGMGHVYEAVDDRLERVVALKLINAELAESDLYRARLAAEARMAARIDSPYVVKIWEHATIEQQPYIAMEFVAGEDLREATAAYSFQRKLDVVYQIAEGIGAAHAAGLLHRDLKPENIKLTAAGKVKIFDFGLAKTVHSDTVDEQGDIEGTLSYVSPEQLAGEPLTLASDLFSFGVILYELFAGVRPFEAEHSASIVYAILHEDPTPPNDVKPDLPEYLTPMIMKLLAKMPEERFADVAEVVAYLQHSQLGLADAAAVSYAKPKKKVTVIGLANESGDLSWDYFCSGFTDDIVKEISRRTDLIVSAEPAGGATLGRQEAFALYRSDFLVSGSLARHDANIELHLTVHTAERQEALLDHVYRGEVAGLFDLLAEATLQVSQIMAAAAGSAARALREARVTDVSAYDLYLQGKSLYQTNRAEDLNAAVQVYSRALDLEPGYALAHAGLADVYTFQYMAYYDRTPERIAAARGAAMKALELAPLTPEAHRSLGRYYMFSGEPQKAEQCFQKAIKCDPKYAIGYRTLGWLKRGNGEYELAADWARKALDLAPTDLETLLLMSLVYMDQRKYTLAVATLRRAVELGPDYGRAYYNLGLVYMKLGAQPQALQNLMLAIKHKGDPNCYIDAGYVALIRGDREAARQRFLESIEKGYLAFVSHYYLGLLERQEGKAAAAESQYGTAIALIAAVTDQAAVDINMQAYRVLALASLGRRDEAVKLLNDLYPRSGGNGEVLWNLARSHALLGNPQQARALIAEAILAHAGPTEHEIRSDPHFAVLGGDFGMLTLM